MKEDEILDAPKFTPPPKNIWMVRFLFLAFFTLLFLVINEVSFLTQALPPFIVLLRNAIFLLLLVMGLYFFIKNIDLRSIDFSSIGLQSSAFIFFGFIISEIIHVLFFYPATITFNYLSIFIPSILIGYPFSFAIYQLLMYRNKWLLPSLYFMMVGLLSLDFLTSIL